MKIAILTMFNGLSTTYSLVNVVKDQLKMLLSVEDISIKMLVSQDCPDEERFDVFNHPDIEWIKITNRCKGKMIYWKDYKNPNKPIHDTFYEEVDAIAADFATYLEDVDVCFLHDILYQGWHLVHNVALRKAQKQLPNTRFLAFTHSAPEVDDQEMPWPYSARFSEMPQTLYIYPTSSGLLYLAKQYNTAVEKCRAISNSLDVFLNLGEEVKMIAERTDLLEPDFLAIYPARMSPAKKFEKIVALLGCLKRVSNRSVKVIFCDFPSADISTKLYKDLILKHGVMHGLDERDIVFTTDIGFPLGVDRCTVLDLFTLSNLFICPSFSESFGLTVLEAASKGNFIVLNEAVPALEELGKKLNAYMLRWDTLNFGFTTHEEYHPSEVEYYMDHAQRLLNILDQNQLVHSKTMVRKEYSPSHILKTQLLPLLKAPEYNPLENE